MNGGRQRGPAGPEVEAQRARGVVPRWAGLASAVLVSGAFTANCAERSERVCESSSQCAGSSSDQTTSAASSVGTTTDANSSAETTVSGTSTTTASVSPVLTSPSDSSAAGTTESDGGGPQYSQTDAGLALSLLEKAREEYRNWPTRTPEPVNISTEIFGLCRLPSLAETAFAESLHGNSLYLLDWLDPGAQAGIAAIEAQEQSDASVPEFEVGATIVKEKLVRTETGFELAALGIMLKREPGFDSTNGDWQFGYWEPEPGMLSGTEEQGYCGGCHAVAPTDFVYLDQTWRLQ